VADAFDAMTHDRPHRSAMSAQVAMNELLRCTPAGYDSDCVGALAEITNLAQLDAMLEPAKA
jgi:HD-GYP domain-containing protein (c-di-GMP phosphodiesterase class II)